MFNASVITPKSTKTAEIAKTPLLDAAANSKEDQQQEQQNGSLMLKRTSAAQEADEGYLFGDAAFFEDPAKLEANILSDFSHEGSIRSQRMDSSMENSLSADGIGNGNELDRTGVGENGGESVPEAAAEAGLNNQENNNQLDGLDAQDNNGNNPSFTRVHFTGAGLAYTYKFELLYLRFTLDSNLGSEHQIDSQAYPAEVQLIAYNNQLYKSFVEASTKPNGLLGISILVNVMQESNRQAQSQTANMLNNNNSNEQFAILVSQAAELKNRGSSRALEAFNLSALLPESNYFVTYEGSLSTPGCYESVTWLLLNKPLYMTQSNVSRKGERERESNYTHARLVLSYCLIAAGREYSGHLHIQWRGNEMLLLSADIRPVFSRLSPIVRAKALSNRQSHRR